MIPILMAGFGAARLVAPKLAQLLVKKGIGKRVSTGGGRPISKVDDLPEGVQNLVKNPKGIASHKEDLRFAAEKAVRQREGAKRGAATRAAKPKTPRVKDEDPTTLMGRTNKTRRQVAEAKAARKKKFYDEGLYSARRSKYVAEKPFSSKVQKQIDNLMQGKEKGAEQARGAIRTTPKNQKGMRLPGKGETVKRMGGGKVKGYKKGGPITYRMAGGQVVDNSYD